MVKITNGIDTFEVTKGAFKTVFANQGYVLASTHATAPQIVSEPVEKTDDERFVDEMLEKPVSAWTKEELKRFAEVNNISLEGVQKVDDVREIISNYIG